ncbi:phosphopantetheine-binding protein [Streptomyces sp. NPDC057638]|uniref:phosphopantetheine-binding protein n=1 Tax=Streptomyces sp. NPDC057638 TaxID=3346190 RepID=UPI003695E1AA
MTSEPESPTPREELLCRLFAASLNLPDVGVDDRFFDLGGDSVAAMGLVVLARDAGLEFSRRELFQNPSPAGLATVARDVPTLSGTEATTGEFGGTNTAMNGAGPSVMTEPLISLSPEEIADIEHRLR